MSAPSMLLLCGGAVASLAGVWSLGGLSESSPLRITPRVSLATLAGLIGCSLFFARGSRELRADLALPLLFGVTSLLALGAGAAKLEAALADKNGARVVRRASGILTGAVLAMAAIGAASLDLSSSSLAHARAAWSFMFALLGSVAIVFLGRARYAGVGARALGGRAVILAIAAAALLVGARLTVAAPVQPIALPPEPPPGADARGAAGADPPAIEPAPADAEASSRADSARAAWPSAAALASTPPSPSSSPSSPSAPTPSSPSSPPSAPTPSAGAEGALGDIEVGEITTRGMLEADARGGVTRRLDRLQGCMANPKHDQHGNLMFKVGVDPSGSVAFIRATGGDLKGTLLGDCLLRAFYSMGFAAPSANNASFNVTLRIP